MINWIKQALGVVNEAEPKEAAEVDTRRLHIAACALFFEMANIDGEFNETERERIFASFKDEYHLSEQQMEELAEEAEKEQSQRIDLWQFTDLICQNYSEKARIRIVEMLWKLVYSDGKLDKHEDYLMRKLSKLLNLTHKQMIDAKLRVCNDANA